MQECSQLLHACCCTSGGALLVQQWPCLTPYSQPNKELSETGEHSFTRCWEMCFHAHPFAWISLCPWVALCKMTLLFAVYLTHLAFRKSLLACCAITMTAAGEWMIKLQTLVEIDGSICLLDKQKAMFSLLLWFSFKFREKFGGNKAKTSSIPIFSFIVCFSDKVKRVCQFSK